MLTFERVVLEQVVLEVHWEEGAHIVSGEAEGHLSQVIGAYVYAYGTV